MRPNVGSFDRLIRIVLAIAVGVLYFQGVITGTLAAVLGIFAVLLLLTGLTSYCPLYAGVGISTCGKKTHSH